MHAHSRNFIGDQAKIFAQVSEYLTSLPGPKRSKCCICGCLMSSYNTALYCRSLPCTKKITAVAMKFHAKTVESVDGKFETNKRGDLSFTGTVYFRRGAPKDLIDEPLL